MNGVKIKDFPLMETKRINGLNYHFVKLETFGYAEIGSVITSIISTCRLALESENFIKEDSLIISRVLEIAGNLIPVEEMDLLDTAYLKALKEDDRDN